MEVEWNTVVLNLPSDIEKDDSSLGASKLIDQQLFSQIRWDVFDL